MSSKRTEAEAYLRRTILDLYLDGYRDGDAGTGSGFPGRETRPASRFRHREHRGAPSTQTRALAELPPRVPAFIVLHYYDDLIVAQIQP